MGKFNKLANQDEFAKLITIILVIIFLIKFNLI
jgi:hypothetical protein